MADILETIDLFGEPVRIFLNRSDTVNTKVGGILTIIMVIMWLAGAWLTGNDIFYRIQPDAYQQSYVSETFPHITFNKTAFPVSFAIQDINSYFIDNPRYYQLTVSQLSFEFDVGSGGVKQRSEVEIPMIKCTKQHYPDLSEEMFYKSRLDHSLCPDTDTLEVAGDWTEAILKFVSVSLKFCIDSEGSGNCAPLEEIIEYTTSNGIGLSMFYIDSFPNLSNYTDPLQKIASTRYRFIDSNSRKISNYLLQVQHLYTDAGFLFDTTEDLEFIKLTELQTDTASIITETQEVIMFNLYSSNKSDLYFKQYIKVPEIIANVGGLLEIFVFVFTHINVPISKIKRCITFSNQVFYTYDQQSETSSQKLVHNNISPNRNISKTKLPLVNLYFKRNGLDTSKRTISDMLKKEDKINLEFSIKDYIRVIKGNLCKSRLMKENKLRSYEIYERKMTECFDMINIVKRLEELQTLKSVLLNQTQLFIFNRLKHDPLVSQEVLVADDILDMLENHIINDETGDIVDKRLLKLAYGMKLD